MSNGAVFNLKAYKVNEAIHLWNLAVYNLTLVHTLFQGTGGVQCPIGWSSYNGFYPGCNSKYVWYF